LGPYISGSTIRPDVETWHVGRVWWDAHATSKHSTEGATKCQSSAEDPSDEGTLLVN